jgi:formylglycine-generating enzyme required for sulfatase activity
MAACSGRARDRAPDSVLSAGRPTVDSRQSQAIRELDECNGVAWCPRLTVIPAGTFMMGTPAGEPGSDGTERPLHRVTIRSFAIGTFEVTRGQWAAFDSSTSRVTTNGCSWDGRAYMKPDPNGSWHDLGFTQDDRHPVVCVTWKDAKDYARWLSQRTGHTYRLPTEAEWEYAGRAGTSTAYPWGATPSHEFANYGADSCCGGRAAGRDTWVNTSPVGSFPPNAFGLYDMNGNVLEWMEDCYATSYAGLSSDGSANTAAVTLQASGDLAFVNGMSSCAFRVLRGGDWGDYPALIRSGFRSFAPPPGETLAHYRSGGVGFRIVRELP